MYSLFIRVLYALAVGLVLGACGGSDEEALPETAAQVEAAFHAAPDLFRVGSNQQGIDWVHGVGSDHVVVRYDESVVYEAQGWVAYANRGTMSNGTDVVLVHEFRGSEDSGQATLFINGGRIDLPAMYVERSGANHLATVRNAREYPGGWLILFASYKRHASLEVPVTYAWLMYRPIDGAIHDYGEYCSRCRRL